MGLDMYLHKRKYVKNWNHEKPEDKYTITIKKGGKEVTSKLPIKEVIYEAAYWRKANAIHNWFTKNVDGSDDNGEESWVPTEKLEELLKLCKLVKKTAKTEKSKIRNGSRCVNGKWEDIMVDGLKVTNSDEIAKLLPPVDGFFFGSTDIDEYYLQNIDTTIEQLEKALADDVGGDFYYSADW